MIKLLILADAFRTVPARQVLQAAAEWRAHSGGSVELWCPENVDSAQWAADAAEFSVSIRAQPGGAPAARAWVAVCLGIAAGNVALLVADGVGLSSAVLRQAGAVLADRDAVLAAGAHGALALVGLRRAVPELFAGAPDALVPATLRARARRLGVSLQELPPLGAA